MGMLITPTNNRWLPESPLGCVLSGFILGIAGIAIVTTVTDRIKASKAKLAAAKKSANFNGDPSDRDPIVLAAQRL